MTNKILHDINETTGLAPDQTVAADAGELMANINDAKVFVRDANGIAVEVADKILNYNSSLAYKQNDLVIKDQQFLQALEDMPPKAFDGNQWLEVSPAGGADGDAIQKSPPTVDHNTVNLTGKGTSVGLRIDPDAAQGQDLFQAGELRSDGKYRSSIGPEGVPSTIFGNTYKVNQTNVGVTFGSRGLAVAYAAGQYVEANASSGDQVIGVIEEVMDANNVIVRTAGRIDNIQSSAVSGPSVLDETMYYLSIIDGELTSTPDPAYPRVPMIYSITGGVGVVVAQPGGYVSREGDAMSGGLSFGNAFVTDAADLSRHIDLKNGDYGFSVTDNTQTLNIISNTTIKMHGDVEITDKLSVVNGITSNHQGLVGGGPTIHFDDTDKPTPEDPEVLGVRTQIDTQGDEYGLRFTRRDLATGDYISSMGTLNFAYDTIPYSEATLLTAWMGDNRYVASAYGVMSGPLTFGNRTVSDRDDLSEHIDLYGGVNGFSVNAAGDTTILASAEIYGKANNAVLFRSEGTGTANTNDKTIQTRDRADARYAKKTVSVTGGVGINGGGELSQDRILSLDTAYVNSNWVVTSRSVTTGNGLNGGGALTTNRVISHANTSDQANVNNSDGTVIQDVYLDEFGHITLLTSKNLDTQYHRLEDNLYREGATTLAVGIDSTHRFYMSEAGSTAYVEIDNNLSMQWFGTGASYEHCKSRAIYKLTGSGFNTVQITGAYEVLRNSCSIQYKTDVKPAFAKGKTGAVIDAIQPESWKHKLEPTPLSKSSIEKAVEAGELPSQYKFKDRVFNGFIAEHMDKVFPEAVTNDGDGIIIDALMALAIEEIKELRKRVAVLEA